MNKILCLSLLLLSLTACNKINNIMDGLEATPGKLDKTQQSMDETKEKLRLATLLETEREILEERNIENIIPIPTGMMAPALKFSESATPEELVRLTDVWLTGINKVTVLGGFDADGKPLTPTAETLNKDFFNKAGKLYGLMAIAGLTPQEKVIQIVHEQLEKKNYYTATLNFLALRGYFLSKILLKEKYFSKHADSADYIETTIKYLKYLNYLNELPIEAYGDGALRISTSGIFPNIYNLDFEMHHGVLINKEEKVIDSGVLELVPTHMQELWAEAARMQTTYVDEVHTTVDGVKSVTAKAELQRLTATAKAININLSRWGSDLKIAKP